MFFTCEEQLAIMQCFWQLLSANPSNEDSKLIENELTRNWEAKKSSADMSPLEIILLKAQCNINNPLPWVLCAVQLDPYKAFVTVSRMESTKKEMFKSMVIRIVNNGDNIKLKTDMSITLFDKTNILYKLILKVMEDQKVRYVLV